MKYTGKKLLAFALCAVLLPGLALAQDRVMAIGSITCLDDLTQDAAEIAEATGNPQIQGGAFGLKAFVEQETFGAAFDTARPVAFVAWVAPDSETPKGFVALPVVDAAKAKDFMPKAQKVEKVDDKTVVATAKHGRTVYVRDAGTWLLFADSLDGFSDSLDCAKVEKLVLDEAAKRDLGLTLFINNVPFKHRQKVVDDFIACVEKKLQSAECKRKRPCLPPPARAAALEGLNRLKTLVAENGYICPVDALALNLSWNHDRKALQFSLELSAPKRSEAASLLADESAENESTIAGFCCDCATASAGVNVTVPALQDKKLKKCFDTAIGQFRSSLKGEHEEAARDFLDAAAPVWYATCFSPDVNRAWNVYLEPQRVLFTAARVVPDGYALEEQLLKIAGFVRKNFKEQAEKLFLNTGSEKVGEFHFYTADVKFDERCCKHPHAKAFREFFGESIPVCIVYAPKAVFFAVGADAKAALMAYVKGDAPKTADEPVAQANLNLGKFLWLAAQHECNDARKANLAKAAEALKDVTAVARLQILSIENGAKLQLEIPGTALQLLSGK